MMKMDFDMSSSVLGNAVSTSSANTLAGDKIHDVTFQGFSYSTSKDGSWEFLDIKFNGVNGGSHNHRGFGFKENANERKATQYGENPSDFESYMMLIKHLINAVAPDLLEDMKSGAVKFVPKKSGDSLFKQHVNFIGFLLEKYIGTETQIKLITNNKGEAALPSFFAGLSKDGVVYMKTNFIGKDLKFTDKEVTNIAVRALAKPTAMPATSVDPLMMDNTTTTEMDAKTSDALDMQW